MLFSCKVSNSILSFLERNGEDLERVYEWIDVPVEFLRDPSYWLEASQMEALLSAIEQEFISRTEFQEIFDIVGHASNQLYAWGVLDSVLRMMQKPQDVYFQPERFLSYFIDPAPPVGGLEREENCVGFDVPVSSLQFPRVTTYLRAAFEALPLIVGQPLASADWKGTHFRVQWHADQHSLFEENNDPGHSVNPNLVRTMALSLEEGQRELERKNKELLIKNQELEAAKEQLEDHLQQKIFTEKLSGVADLAMGLVDEINSPVAHVVSNVQRLQDYFSRAQQLITLLVGQGRNDPQVREAMRRVDWEFVRSEFPHVAEESLKGVSRIREIVKDLTVLADSKTIADGDMEDVDLNLVVEKAVKVVRSQAPMGVKIDHHLFLDRKIPVFPQRIEQALVHIITYAAHSIEGEGSVRVVARPHGGKVEVEISDTGSGMDADTIARVFLPFSSNQVPMGGSSLGLSLAHSIVKMHKGNIRVLSQVGRGSTFVIDLPTEVLN